MVGPSIAEFRAVVEPAGELDIYRMEVDAAREDAAAGPAAVYPVIVAVEPLVEVLQGRAEPEGADLPRIGDSKGPVHELLPGVAEHALDALPAHHHPGAQLQGRIA